MRNILKKSTKIINALLISRNTEYDVGEKIERYLKNGRGIEDVPEQYRDKYSKYIASVLRGYDYFDNRGLPIYNTYKEFSTVERQVFHKKSLETIISNRHEDNSTDGLPHFNNSFEFTEQSIGKNTKRFILKHAPIPILKKQLNEQYVKYEKYIKIMSKYRFRTYNDISSQYILASYNAYHNNSVLNDNDNIFLNS